MIVIGLDLSLTRTGVATADGTEVVRTTATGMERLAAVRDAVWAIVAGQMYADPSGMPADALVVIEGYSMGTARQQSHAHALGELGGVVRLHLFEAGVPFVDVAPAALKKYATGKGNANKGQVLEAASKRSGLDFAGDDNRADAWWLRQMGLAWTLGDVGDCDVNRSRAAGVVPMPLVNRQALASVRWPDRAAVAS